MKTQLRLLVIRETNEISFTSRRNDNIEDEKGKERKIVLDMEKSQPLHIFLVGVLSVQLSGKTFGSSLQSYI